MNSLDLTGLLVEINVRQSLVKPTFVHFCLKLQPLVGI